MQDWLQRQVTTAALCWRLDRRDGVTVGFTGHDRDIMRDGLVYRAAPGMVPSAITQEAGFAVDSMEVSGAITSDAITETDLMTGRWDGAKVRLFAVDWEDAAGPAVLLARGDMGDIAVRDEGFSAELRGPMALLEQPVVEQTSPECRAQLGDRRCRVDLARVTVLAEVVAVMDSDRMTVSGIPVGRPLGYGRVRWLSGTNSGFERAILAADGAILTLREPPPFAMMAGDRVEIVAGCDKRLATCRDQFANVVNFRGEPHLPGNDLLTRYPGA